MNRQQKLQSIVNFSRKRSVLSEFLQEIGWDYEGEILTVYRVDIAGVVEKFLSRDISEDDLIWWANAIELREDLEFESTSASEIRTIIHQLANPDLEGRVSRDKLVSQFRF